MFLSSINLDSVDAQYKQAAMFEILLLFYLLYKTMYLRLFHLKFMLLNPNLEHL